MNMKKIDLTKCNNLRYKAKVDGNDDYGCICVENADTGLAFLRSERDNGYVALWSCVYPIVLGIGERKVTDFELVPRDPETYRDWQVGDKVCEDEHRNACYEVIFRSGELVVFKDWNNWASNPMTCSEAFTRFGMRLVLTDIENQIIEERKKYEPQEGDICYVKTDSGNRFVFIKRDNKADDGIYGYAIVEPNTRFLSPAKVSCVCDGESIREIRPATDEEKQMLFDAMAKEGKRWNAEKKVVEDIPKPHEFKKGEPVLVRTDYGRDWFVAVYVENSSNSEAQFGKYGATDGRSIIFYRFCLPYNERTMHLLGTSEDYKEE